MRPIPPPPPKRHGKKVEVLIPTLPLHLTKENKDNKDNKDQSLPLIRKDCTIYTNSF